MQNPREPDRRRSGSPYFHEFVRRRGLERAPRKDADDARNRPQRDNFDHIAKLIPDARQIEASEQEEAERMAESRRVENQRLRRRFRRIIDSDDDWCVLIALADERITQEFVAKVVGVHRSTISRFVKMLYQKIREQWPDVDE